MDEEPKEQEDFSVSGNWVKLPKDMSFEQFMAWRAEQKKKRKATKTKAEG